MLENLEIKLNEITNKYNSFKDNLQKEKLLFEADFVAKELSKSEIYTNLEESTKLSKKQSEIDYSLSKIKAVENLIADINVLIDFAKAGDETVIVEIEQSLVELKKRVDNLYLETLYSEKFDDSDALVVIHAGAGGEEAQDWVDMLTRMYQKYFSKINYTFSVIDRIAGDGAGTKSITMIVSGKHCYGNMKCERGVHRLVRISPFDANSRRHTSFASVEVSPILEKNNQIEINPADLKIDTYRSSGAGGQHVNKTESAIRITHLPTGIVVACQNERSQVQNKEQAMKMLTSKLIELEEKKEYEEKQKQLDSQKKIEWGSQIRSYVLHPYNMVKDHRTDYSTSDTTGVLDGEIEQFIIEVLKQNKE